MKIKIQIRTPKGQAKNTNDRIKPWILGRTNHQTFVNQEDDTILWEVEGKPKDLLRINRNVAAYGTIIKGIFGSGQFKKWFANKFSEEEKTQLKEMLLNGTQVEVIKQATTEELVEENKTWWEKLKEKFKPA